MKAITLTQPWATLVAIGAKRIETRSWATAYRGPLAIHAAKGFAPGGKQSYIDFCMTRLVYEALYAAGLVRAGSAVWDLMELPRGRIVATCNLVDVQEILLDATGYGYVADGHRLRAWYITQQERAFGDYTPGRYAWLLADVEMLPEPIPAKGALGLWEWEQ